MDLADVRTKAKVLGIKAGKMKKAELIRAIQLAEGNFDCFGRATDFCDQSDCSFMDDCLGSKRIH